MQPCLLQSLIGSRVSGFTAGIEKPASFSFYACQSMALFTGLQPLGWCLLFIFDGVLFQPIIKSKDGVVIKHR